MLVLACDEQSHAQAGKYLPPRATDIVAQQPWVNLNTLTVAHHLCRVTPGGVVLRPELIELHLLGYMHKNHSPRLRSWRHNCQAPRYILKADRRLVVDLPPCRRTEKVGTSSTG